MKHSYFKINIASLIFLTFIFRLAFLNASLLNTLKAPQSNKISTSSSFSTFQSVDKRFVELSKLKLEKYASLEFYEENNDNEEDLLKSNSPILLAYLESSFKAITNSPKSNNLFDAIKCKLYPKRYLSLSILRI